jgi:hypothetical protein
MEFSFVLILDNVGAGAPCKVSTGSARSARPSSGSASGLSRPAMEKKRVPQGSVPAPIAHKRVSARLVLCLDAALEPLGQPDSQVIAIWRQTSGDGATIPSASGTETVYRTVAIVEPSATTSIRSTAFILLSVRFPGTGSMTTRIHGPTAPTPEPGGGTSSCRRKPGRSCVAHRVHPGDAFCSPRPVRERIRHAGVGASYCHSAMDWAEGGAAGPTSAPQMPPDHRAALHWEIHDA